MNRRNCLILACIAAVASSLLGGLATGAQEKEKGDSRGEPLDTYRQLRLALIRLATVEYTARMERRELFDPSENNPSGGDGKTQDTEQDIEFAQSGRKFYSQFTLTKNKTKIFKTVVAYDGKDYQQLMADRGTLQVRSQVPRLAYSTMQPLIIPYLFAFRESDPFEYGSLLNIGIWEDLAACSSVDGEEVVEGQTCMRLKLKTSYEHRTNQITVWLAKGLNYLPLRVFTEVDKKAYGETRVTAYEAVGTAAGTVVVPTKITINDYVLPEKKLYATMQFQIMPASLRVNSDIPDDRFVISKDLARLYVHEDQGGTVQSIDPAPLAPSSSDSLWLWLAPVGLVAVTVLVFWRIKRTRKDRVQAPH